MSGKIFATNKTVNLTNDPNDATNVHGDVTATTVGTSRGLDVNIIGGVSVTVNLGGSPLKDINYDCFTFTSGATTDTWAFKTGGVGGTTVATLTNTYTSSTKVTLVSGVWT